MVKVIGQNRWHHQIPWPQKHRSWHQNHHPKCLSSKVLGKDGFLHNGGQRNAFAYISLSNHSRWFLIYWKALTQGMLIWWQFVQQELRYGQKCDSTESWPSKVKVIHEDQKALRSARCHLPISKHVKFPKSGQEKKKERIWRKHFHAGNWLTLCDANYTVKEWPDVKWPDPNLNISLPKL